MYTCPMHSEVKSETPGKCPKCGMNLVKEGEQSSSVEKTNYVPLLTIVGIIILVALVLTSKEQTFNLKQSIAYFMSGFFLIFSGFKMLDLKGFAQGYSMYDLLAKRVFVYGYIYPFIELLFGLGMIINPFSKSLLTAELVVMSFSGLGVIAEMAKKRKIQCVCLGTVIKVPLTSVTLVEDFGMAFLALLMLLLP